VNRLRRALNLAALAGLATNVPGFALAADAYPSKPVRFIVPFAAGGTSDMLAREIGARLSTSLGQPFVVDNKVGAGGNIGTAITARAEPDGYTIQLTAIAIHAMNKHLFTSMPFDPLRDFTPISLVTTSMNILVVNSNVPAHSVQELIALAKARPGKLNFGSPTNGSTAHLAGEMFKSLTGTKMTHVPYRGSAAALNDLLAGNIQLMFENQPVVMPHVRSGRLRALAVTGLTRSPAIPDIPTIAESGVPGFDVTAWFAIVGPAGMPPAIVDTLNKHIRAILTDPEMKQKLAAVGANPEPSTPAELAERMQRDYDRWGEVIRASGAKID
jgi:tripartite-type tricarboxylate transporter receptor subunit TctC